jgi:hypothetical protein
VIGAAALPCELREEFVVVGGGGEGDGGAGAEWISACHWAAGCWRASYTWRLSTLREQRLPQLIRPDWRAWRGRRLGLASRLLRQGVLASGRVRHTRDRTLRERSEGSGEPSLVPFL